MNIREPRQFDSVRAKRRTRNRLKSLKKFLIAIFVAVIAVVLLGYGAYARPLPKLQPKVITPSPEVQQVALSWPTAGQASVGVDGQGVLDSTPGQTPTPTASVAKVMMALTVLKKYPLKPGEQGPMVPITANDVDIYNKYYNNDGSVVRVEVGEQISEYQALQAALLPSANNISDTLAIWAYGSMGQYHLAANQLAQSLGMIQSTFAGDASGFLPETVSTAHDLILMGQAAMDNPVVKEIVAQKTADIPLVGTVTNVNFLLGRDGVIGIKTGNTDQAGGCYLVATDHTFANGKKVTMLAAVMGAPSLANAMSSSLALLNSAYNGFAYNVVVPRGTAVADYQAPWGGSTQAITLSDLTVFGWKASKATIKVKVQPITAPQSRFAQVGTISAETPYDGVSMTVSLNQSIGEPTTWWRIYRH